MKYEQYVSLIKRLEAYSDSHPRAYKYRVLGVALVGYAYFIGLIVLLLAFPAIFLIGLLLAPAVVLRLAFVLGKLWFIIFPGLGFYFAMIGSAVKSFCSRVPDPDLRELKADEAPELHEFIKKTSRELVARAPKKVYISDSFNAAVLTLPRFGLFGQRVHMVLGLPLMKSLSLEQFQAVVAHEIGHISGKHGSFAKMASHLERSWANLFASQEDSNHKFGAFYEKFANWFFPFFAAYSFVLMREQERDADRYAVQLVGARPLGEALVAMHTRDAEVEQTFWRRMHEENVEKETPSQKSFSEMLGSMAFVDEGRAGETLTRALEVRTGYDDTHPSLADRLKAIGFRSGDEPLEIPELPPATASDVYLTRAIDSIVQEFDQKWDEQFKKEWAERHQHFQESKKRISELDAKIERGEITADEMNEFVRRTVEKDGLDASMPLLKQAYERFPENSTAMVNYGGALLSKGDESGIEILKEAARIDRTNQMTANRLIFDYLHSKGRHDEAKVYADIIDTMTEEYDQATRERSDVTGQDRFARHELSDEVVEKVKQELEPMEQAGVAFLVKKVVAHFPEIPFHVLFIEVWPEKGSNRIGKDDGPALLAWVVRRLDNGDIHYFATLQGKFAGLRPVLDAIDGAKILDRSLQPK